MLITRCDILSSPLLSSHPLSFSLSLSLFLSLSSPCVRLVQLTPRKYSLFLLMASCVSRHGDGCRNVNGNSEDKQRILSYRLAAEGPFARQHNVSPFSRQRNVSLRLPPPPSLPPLFRRFPSRISRRFPLSLRLTAKVSRELSLTQEEKEREREFSLQKLAVPRVSRSDSRQGIESRG